MANPQLSNAEQQPTYAKIVGLQKSKITDLLVQFQVGLFEATV